MEFSKLCVCASSYVSVPVCWAARDARRPGGMWMPVGVCICYDGDIGENDNVCFVQTLQCGCHATVPSLSLHIPVRM